MVDTGDLFMLRYVPRVREEGKYLAMVVEPHHSGTGWSCEIFITGLKYRYEVHEIEEGKKLLEGQTS